MALSFYDASDVRMMSAEDDKEDAPITLNCCSEGSGCDADDESSAGTVAFNVGSWQSMPGCAKGSASQGQRFGNSCVALFKGKSTMSQPGMPPLGRLQRQAGGDQPGLTLLHPSFIVGSLPGAHS